MRSEAGAATDASGRAAPDPTANVIDMLEAGAKRADDLRAMAEKCRAELADKDAVIEVWKFRFYEERDRRLTEAATLREKALSIKEEGDAKAARILEEANKEARELARVAQRDRDEAAAKSADFVLAQQTRNEGVSSARTQQAVSLNLLIGLAGVLLAAALLAAAVVLN